MGFSELPTNVAYGTDVDNAIDNHAADGSAHGTWATSGHGHALSAISTLAGLVIVHDGTSWSGDAPSRAAGVNPIVFISAAAVDPADPTNGIATPANINSKDRWVKL